MKTPRPKRTRLRLGALAPALGAYFAVAASTAAGWAPAEQPTIAFAFVVEGNTGPETAKLVLQALRNAPQ